jgi:hypothetical protein
LWHLPVIQYGTAVKYTVSGTKQVNLLTFNTRFDETLEPLARMESFAKYLQALLLLLQNFFYVAL